jgi:hypothetical protein
LHYIGDSWTEAAHEAGIDANHSTPSGYLWDANLSDHKRLSIRDRLRIVSAVLLSNTFEDGQAENIIYTSISTREIFDLTVGHFRGRYVGNILSTHYCSVRDLPRLMHAVPKLTVRARDINRAIIVAAARQQITMLSKLLVHSLANPERYFAPALLALVKSNGNCMEKKACIEAILNAQSKPLSCGLAIRSACEENGWLIIGRTLICHPSVKLRRKTVSVIIMKMGYDVARAWLRERVK